MITMGKRREHRALEVEEEEEAVRSMVGGWVAWEGREGAQRGNGKEGREDA